MSLQDSHQISDIKIMLTKGIDGNGISSIEKTGSQGLVDIYTITFTDGTKTTFTVTNGVSGGMSSLFIITSEEGATITVTSPTGRNLDVVPVSGSSTQWQCESTEYGEHTIVSTVGGSPATRTVDVDVCKIYEVSVLHFSASITATFPEGTSCVCQGGGESSFSSSSPHTFDVHSADTYTLTVTYNGVNYTTSVTITTDGQSESVFCPEVATAPTDDINLWLMYGGVSGSYSTLDDILADSTALATLMASTDAVNYLVRSKLFAGNLAVIPVMTDNTHPSGVASVDGDGANYLYYVDGVSESVSTLNALKPYAYRALLSSPSYRYNGIEMEQSNNNYISLMYEFDPVTIAKVSVDQFYLLKGSLPSITGTFKISARNHTTQAWTELYSDAVIGSTARVDHNGILYNGNFADADAIKVEILNSTAWGSGIGGVQIYTPDGICQNSSAMSYVGSNNYCANTLIADSTWVTAIANSSYKENVLNVKVPTMTGDTTPSGQVIYSAQNVDDGRLAWKAFDNNDGTTWDCYENVPLTTNQYIGYVFDMPVRIVCAEIMPENGARVKNFKVRGSAEGNTWNNIYSGICKDNSSLTPYKVLQRFAFTNNTAYQYNVVFVEDIYSGQTMIGAYTVQLYGRIDV